MNKPFDPFDHCDDDWTKAVYEVGKTLPGHKPECVSPFAASPPDRGKKEVYDNMRAMAAKCRERRKIR